VEASNATLLATTASGERVIYKPMAGARPLHDFPAETLALREVWSYRMARALGLSIVPETVLGDGPYGVGAIQRFVEGVADDAVVDMINRRDSRLWDIAVFDVIANNADRKVGHVLRQESGVLWAIDHGLTFHVDDKLRTVLWSLSGLAIPSHLIESIEVLMTALDGSFGESFAAELSAEELAATVTRAKKLAMAGAHPEPPRDRPAMPWPPY